MTSFWKHAEKYPPCLVRLLARHRNGPPLTTTDIVGRSGLDHYTVSAISFSVSWDDIRFGQMEAFLLACDCDFTNRAAMNRKAVYLKLPRKFHYLKRSPEWESVLQHLVARYREHLASKINPR